jgi:cephalosporin hydroxylase
MKLTIDTDERLLTCHSSDSEKTIDLYSKEAFELVSAQWVRVGWACKYPYTFSWMGRPIIQLPEDLIRVQEAIYMSKPDVIVETGVAHGGSLIFYSSLCRAIGKGRVIGVDVEIRPHNRRAIEAHDLFDRITLIEGDSVASEIVQQVKDLIAPGETCMVILDSCHTKAHVLAELEAYHDIVTPGSWAVATDGVMRDVYDVPRGVPEWKHDNPTEAAKEFLASHDEFVLETPTWPFNESPLTENVTHYPGGWLRRVKP